VPFCWARTGERNIDHRDNWPIFAAAASLRAPLCIHPQVPQPRVRAALYAGFDDAIDNAFATYGIGWHYESGVQFLRLALAGVFDRFPDLHLLLGDPSDRGARSGNQQRIADGNWDELVASIRR
jgi:uncharacterized protein